MSGCNINVDAEGNLIEAEPSDTVDKPTPVVNSRIEKDILRFAAKDQGDAGVIEFEMTLVESDVAHLHVINAPVPIQPIRFTRTAARR